jgi:hypothetical protein
VGDKAGNKKGSGYWQVCVDGKWYQLHRVIWEMFNGQIPENLEVDHEDRNTDNNLINNLRLATRSQNAFNRGVQSNNKLGIKGVSKVGNRFKAYIKILGNTKNLGSFATAEEASAAYQKALNDVH